MKHEDYYKAHDLLLRINMIDRALASETIDDTALEKLDVIMRAAVKDKISAFAKKELMSMKEDLENKFNTL